MMHGKFVEWVYDSLMGNLAEQYRCKQVENLFEDGKSCMQCYSDAMEAYAKCMNTEQSLVCKNDRPAEKPQGDFISEGYSSSKAPV